jgi:prepilin-type N-terminal cleavage/methylation domain-containing protein
MRVVRVDARPSSEESMTRSSSPRGFTLIEMLIAIVVLGALTALAFPRMRQFGDTMAVRNGRSALANLVTQTRSRALTRGAPARLQVTQDSVWIELQVGGAWQAVGVSEQVMQRGGLAYAGPATLTFLPTGAAVIPGGQPSVALAVSHAGHSKSVVVTRYGRIQ